MMLLSGWFLITLDDEFFDVDTSSFQEIGGWTSKGVRGLDVLHIGLVSILEFTEVDSFFGVGLSTLISRALTSTVGYLVLGPSPSLTTSTFVIASSISTLMDSITVFVLLLNTPYA